MGFSRCTCAAPSEVFQTCSRQRAFLVVVVIAASTLVLSFRFTGYRIQDSVASLAQRMWLTSASGRGRCRWNATDEPSNVLLRSLLTSSSNSSPGDVRQRRKMFVTLPGSSARLGNQMFGHAALLGVAYCTGYQPVVFESSMTSRQLLSTFALSTPVLNRATSGSNRWHERHVSIFTPPENMSKSNNDGKSAADADVELIGYFQSWRYFADVPDLVMSDFRFKPFIAEAASRVVDGLLKSLNMTTTNSSSSSRPILVGIHARRSDMALMHHLKRGYTVADEAYFRHAIEYVEGRLAKSPNDSIVYIVCSDEPAWAQSNIRSKRFPVVLASSQSTSTAVDLAVLASCDHVIISTGTYSWWAGYLAKAQQRRLTRDAMVVYYAGFPPANSEIGSGFHPSDVYPPAWIALT